MKFISIRYSFYLINTMRALVKYEEWRLCFQHMINNFAITWRLCYSLESWLTRQIMVPMIVIALINCWEHLYNLFWELSLCFLHIYRQWFLWSVISCWLPQLDLWYINWVHQPSLRYRRLLPWLGWAWRRALTQRALCPLMPWSRRTKIVLPWGWFLSAKGVFNPAYKGYCSIV